MIAVAQRDLTEPEHASVYQLLDAASDQFRAASQQQFTPPGESTVRLKVNGGRVRLDQLPVTGGVTSVTDDAGNSVDYTRNGMWLTVGCDSSRFLTVTYSHGGEVPPRVKNAVAEMVIRALVTPEEVMAGARSLTDSAGPISQTTAWSVRAPNSGLQMSESDLKLAASFRWQGGQVIVQAP